MRIGIEIHQRIDSHKLFCECPSLLNEGEAELKVFRRLHTVYSELGEVDLASKREFEKGKVYEYLSYKNCNCLVEMDEEPPHPLNKHALAIALEISMHLNCKLVDEIHVMRKIIIDGSNTSGFQRTAVIALTGIIDTTEGIVRIPQISIEEESAGIVEATNEKAIFKLDRLGMPLIEITTDTDIKNGQHLLEVAEKIGMIMRATGKVARGLGTIRQDLNVSIDGGGARVEIKGAQELKLLPMLLEQEVLRQKNLIKIMDEMRARFSGKVLVGRSFFDLTHIFNGTNSKIIKNGTTNGQKVFGVKLQHHAGVLGKEVGINRRYGTELSDYAKTAGVKGIIHSDELMEKYDISIQEVNAIKKGLNMQEDDAFVLVVAPELIAKKALENVCIRSEMDFVPKETRRANPDGSTSYMRPLPGRARFYPETDIPPIRITDELIKNIEKEKSEGLESKKKKLKKILNPEMAEKILKSKNLKLFEKIVEELNVDATLVATTLENTLVSLRRDGVELENLENMLLKLFETYGQGKFVKAAIPEILKLVAKGKTIDVALVEGKLERVSGKELEKIARENNFDIQKIMQKYRLNVEPSDLQKIKR